MTPDQKAQLSSALPKLQIRDVILAGSVFARPMQDAPDQATSWQQHKRGVQFAVEDTESGKELHVLVQLGTRLLLSDKATPADDGAVQLSIEADFVVRYALAEEIDGEALAAFAHFNAVHNVWPFWRQHVFDIVQRGRLPKLEVPLFAGGKP